MGVDSRRITTAPAPAASGVPPGAALLGVREAARRLGVSYSAFKQWIYRGSVRTVRTSGGHHRIPLAEVDRLLAHGPAPPTSTGTARTTPRGVLVALSGRNQLRGIVDEVRHDGLLAQVRLRIGDQRLTAVITRDALVELGLKRGDEAVAIVKSTEVMIGREDSSGAAPRRRRGPASRGTARDRRSR
ncbi:MAG: TOBE domain-containing protein [Vicinamibacterales bacterium]